MKEDYIKTETKIFLDGKEVTNFAIEEAPIIATNEAQSGECLKLYDSFSGTITLSRKQAKRMLRVFRKAERKAARKYRWEKIKSVLRLRRDDSGIIPQPPSGAA